MSKRIALVTGGTGGIGSAICRHLHDMGATVIAGYNHGGHDEKARGWQAENKAEGYTFKISYGDVSNFESMQAMVESIEKEVGPIDILVNNAGITRDNSLKKMKPSEWEAVININLNSAFNLTRNVIGGMIERGFGRIVSISSINGQKGQFGQTNYSAAKAGLYGFSKALALEVAKKGITVNTVSPGYVATEMVTKVPKDILDKIIAEIPVGRLASPDEIARTVAFLAADDAGMITGANIAVNGGHHMY